MRIPYAILVAASAAMAACSGNADATETPAPTQATAPQDPVSEQDAAQPEPAEYDVAEIPPNNLVDCELTFEGTTYIDGICEFSPDGDSGDFQISGVEYFAQVSIFEDGSAVGSWNGEPSAMHAHGPLGELTRDGACWVGKKARVCARKLSPAAEKRARAAWPTAGWLRPVLNYYWQHCLGADGALEPGAAIVLKPCDKPENRIFERGDDGTLTIANRPDLCLDLEGPGMMKPPVLIANTCGTDPAHFVYTGGGHRSAPIRGPGGLCATLPETEEDGGSAPYSVVMKPCDDSDARVVKFTFSN